jgi:hypothetical protein
MFLIQCRKNIFTRQRGPGVQGPTGNKMQRNAMQRSVAPGSHTKYLRSTMRMLWVGQVATNFREAGWWHVRGWTPAQPIYGRCVSLRSL